MTIKAASSTQNTNKPVDALGDPSKPMVENVTGTRTDQLKRALDVATRFVTDISGADKTVLADSTTRKIISTAHGARKGDMIRFITGPCAMIEVGVLLVPDANTIILDAELPATPVNPNTFRVHRFITQAVGPDGSQIVSVTAAPIQFVKDGVDTEVEEDSADPANNELLPTKEIDVQAFSGIKVDISAATDLVPVVLVADVGPKPIRKIQIFYPSDVCLKIQADDGGEYIVTMPASNNGMILPFFCLPNSEISVLVESAADVPLTAPMPLRINGWY